MDKDGLREYINSKGKGEITVNRIVNTVSKFEKYLPDGKTVDDTSPEDLFAFLEMYTTEYVTKYNLNHLRAYYKATENEKMEKAIKEGEYIYTPPYKLSEFYDIDEEYIEKLEKEGIKTNNQLLKEAETPEERKVLSKRTSVPLNVIEKLTKLSDLSRIFAVKAIRAKLYYDAGVDTVEKIAQWDPTEFREMIEEYVENSDFPGEPTLQKEADFTVDYANKLPKKVKF
ncbi:MAG: DUF4332 domain-containing protein [Thermoplasmatota archaeon]